MTEETKNNINIDGAEHAIDDLTPEQKKILAHIADLEYGPLVQLHNCAVHVRCPHSVNGVGVDQDGV